MRITLTKSAIHNEVLQRVEELSGQEVMKCYQCGNCSAGCPAAGAMDRLPNEIIRLLQMGQIEEALGTRAIWYCAACLQCQARCPKGIDLARLTEALRTIALEKGLQHIDIADLPAETLSEMPQQAFIGGFRKYSI